MINCLNCANQFNRKFCNECGQKAATHRFTMHEWLHEIPHSIFHVDNGFFYTFKNLCSRPGNMIREYLDGRRKDYFSPFLYILIMCGIFIVVSHLFADDAHAKNEITDLKSAGEYAVNNYYKPLVVAMILPTTLASFLIFFRSGFYFAEHLVLNTFITAQLIIGDIILSLVAATHLAEGRGGLAALLNLLLKFPYWIWVYWQFFKPQKIWLGALQVLAAVILSSVFAQLMLEGVVYLLFLFKGGSH